MLIRSACCLTVAPRETRGSISFELSELLVMRVAMMPSMLREASEEWVEPLSKVDWSTPHSL